MDIMIDIEALDKRPSGVILTIGAQLFDPTAQEPWPEGDCYDSVCDHWVPSSLNVRVDVDQQLASGRTTDEGTIAWWATQSPEAQEEAFGLGDRLPLATALNALCLMTAVCGPRRHVRVWSKGPTYDVMMLEHAMEECGIKPPWEFWGVRDARTVYSLCPRLDTRKNGPISHRALDDCRRQIMLLREAYAHLGITQSKGQQQ